MIAINKTDKAGVKHILRVGLMMNFTGLWVGLNTDTDHRAAPYISPTGQVEVKLSRRQFYITLCLIPFVLIIAYYCEEHPFDLREVITDPDQLNPTQQRQLADLMNSAVAHT